VLVLVATPTSREAKMITQYLLDAKLAACVSIEEGNSLFFWDGDLRDQKQYSMRIKTTLAKLDELETVVKKYHSDEVPEILVIPIIAGSKDYLDWVSKSCQ